MVITDLEIAQASIELMGGFVSGLLAIIVAINRHPEASMKQIVKMLFLCTALFVSDALAYLFRGNTDTVSICMARICNFSVFFLNFRLAYVAVGYIYSILQEKQVVPKELYRKIVHLGFWAAVVILAVNLFTGWMYYFDGDNYYHRNWGWYVYTGLSLVCLLVSCVPVIQYRRALDRFTRFSLLLFELFPIIAVVIQCMFYGISVSNMGIGLCIVLILVSYLVDLTRSDSAKGSVQRRRSYDTSVLFIIMAVSVSASIICCIISIRHIAAEISQTSSQVIARIVGDHLENTFLRPITVTETMSKDYSLQKYMKQSSGDNPMAAEQEIAASLEAIHSGFDYRMVYAVCQDSGNYYTYDGFVKTVDPEHDPADRWYRNFVASGQNCALELDTDEANAWALSVFVNTAVRSPDGTLLGVCGVGLELETLHAQLKEFEDRYQIKITLYDRNGRYQIQSGSTQLGEGLLPEELAEMEDAQEYRLQTQDGILRMSGFLKSLGWYLTIDDLAPGRVDITRLVMLNIVVFLAGMFLLVVAFCVITIRERNIARELEEKRKNSLHDELTGLKNRRALLEDCEQLQQAGTLKEQALILMDLNELKRTNDTLGHQAGDELIQGTAQCLTEAMGDVGQLYRTGGDEFVAILSCSQQELHNRLTLFQRLADSWKGSQTGPISVAKGVVSCAESPDYSTIMDLADQRMYEDKEKYYLSTGKKRRQ